MSAGALLFMLIAWGCVLSLTVWSYLKLLKTPQEEKLPPPGTSL